MGIRKRQRGRTPPKRAYPDLLTWREAHGWNQREAAQFLGCSQSAYAQMELGRRIPVRDELKHLLHQTGVPIEVFVGVAG